MTDPQPVTFAQGRKLMVDGGFDVEQFEDKWTQWLERGDDILIFENNDLGHPELGRRLTMPWASADPLPPHGPDNPSIGFGWRYTTDYIIKKWSDAQTIALLHSFSDIEFSYKGSKLHVGVTRGLRPSKLSQLLDESTEYWPQRVRLNDGHEFMVDPDMEFDFFNIIQEA